MDPIVITTQEVAKAQIPLQGAQEVRPKVPNPVPLWTRLLFVPLVLVLRSDSDTVVREEGFTVPIALDPTFGVGGALQVPGTPTAVRLRDGAVASTVPVGGPEVLGLLASVRVLG